MIPPERASQEEQNNANFSFIAPSSEELSAVKVHCGDDLYHDIRSTRTFLATGVPTFP